jgi:phosphoribosylpyrophosphate synthetase
MGSSSCSSSSNFSNSSSSNSSNYVILHIDETMSISVDVEKGLGIRMQDSGRSRAGQDAYPNGSPCIYIREYKRLDTMNVIIIIALRSYEDLSFATLVIGALEDSACNSITVVLSNNMYATDDRSDILDDGRVRTVCTAKHSIATICRALANHGCKYRIMTCEPHNLQVLQFGNKSTTAIDCMTHIIGVVFRSISPVQVKSQPGTRPKAPRGNILQAALRRLCFQKDRSGSGSETCDAEPQPASRRIPCVVLPDNGAAKRYEKVLTDLNTRSGMQHMKCVLMKSRLNVDEADKRPSISGYDSDLINETNVSSFVIIDDIIRTGDTILAACAHLRAKFPETPIYVVTVHADFVKNAEAKLANAYMNGTIQRIFLSDSNQPCVSKLKDTFCSDNDSNNTNPFTIVPIGPVIASAIQQR